MNVDDDNHASNQSTKMKVRRSMDIEFHDHVFDDLLDELHELDMESEEYERALKSGGEADGDSFGEASDTCQPDHEFLDLILEEHHPERINLLDPTVPESVYMKKPKNSALRSASCSAAPKKGEEETPQLAAASSNIAQNPSSSKNTDARSDGVFVKNSMLKREDNSESDNEEDASESFMKSPLNRSQQLGVDRTKQIGSLGEETNKSLRTINGTFWSKPFKGLTPNRRGDEDATGVADS